MSGSQIKNSRFPGPMSSPRSATSAQGDDGPDRPPTVAQLLQELLARFSLELTAEERTWLLGQVTDDAAHKMGARINVAQVVAEMCRALQTLGWWIREKQVTGYGPRRARFALDLVRGVLPDLAELQQLEREEAETADQLRRLGDAVAPARRDAGAVLSAFRTGKATRSNDEEAVKTAPGAVASRPMKLLTAKADRLREGMPASLLDDAGLTGATVDTLARGSAEIDALRLRLARQRERAQTLRYQLAAPAGRIHRELKALAAFQRKARKGDPKLPEFTSSLALKAKRRARKPKAAKAPKGPATPPAPTPV